MDNIPTEPGQSYANVKWQLPVPTDNSKEPPTLNGLRPPQKLGVGKKQITYKVTDSSGLSRSCIFFIHVKGTHCIHLKGVKSYKFIHYGYLVVHQITSSIWSYSVWIALSFSEVECLLCQERDTRRNSEFQTKFKPMFDLVHRVKLMTTKAVSQVQITV